MCWAPDDVSSMAETVSRTAQLHAFMHQNLFMLCHGIRWKINGGAILNGLSWLQLYYLYAYICVCTTTYPPNSIYAQHAPHSLIGSSAPHSDWSAIRHPTHLSRPENLQSRGGGDGREKKNYWMQKLEWKGEFLCMYMQGNKKISWWMRRKGQGMADKRSMFACKAFLSSISQMYAPAPAPYLILTLLPTWDLFWVKI